ncbi:retroviral-like aspartic protease family protein [Flaviaesturariibacter amylovorans]|uniref:Peptidase A2 domain-containing protein n=1 Tax=Flaviaesturariibacter amylovorans TaxID=1084520 RepID=A0ABP8HN85_9BACT
MPSLRRHILLLALLLLGATGTAWCDTGAPGRPQRAHKGHHRIGPKRPVLPRILFHPDSTATVIPFNRVGNLMLVQATADTIEGNFIFDTGAAQVLLNSTYFRDYPATLVDLEGAGATGSTGALQRITLGNLRLGDLEYRRQDADLGNLGHLENTKGVRILGLLGMSLFRDCELLIDYEHNLLYIHRVRRRESVLYTSQTLSAAPSYVEFPIELKENFILLNTEIGGKKLQFVMDSGAESSVLDSRLPNSIFAQVQINRRVLLNGAGARKTEAFYGTLAQMKVGSQQLSALPVLISSLEHTCFADMSCINGILSFDAFAPRRMGFNFVTRKMYLWK